MDPDFVFCRHCGHKMRHSRISIDVSGSGFTMEISNIPVFGCDKCRTLVKLVDEGPTIEDITTAVVSALEKIGPSGYAPPIVGPAECIHCRRALPKKIDKSRAHFSANAIVRPGNITLGVRYLGDSITCASCGSKHPYLTPARYHEITSAIYRAASVYL